MKVTYDTGIEANQIMFEVTVGTVGTAYTSANLVSAEGQQVKVSESNENSGNISERELGKASELKKKYLVVRSIIDFSNIDKAFWKNQIDNLDIQYKMSGGFSGNQVYHQDENDVNPSPNGKTLIITKAIELI